MHRLVVPKFSSEHRFACLALYRALLRQCTNLPQTALELIAAQSHVRERFRRYRHLQSPSQTANALRAGYEALDLLHSATKGNKTSIRLISAILGEADSVKRRKQAVQDALAKARPVKEPSAKQRKIVENVRRQEMTAKRHPEAESILMRPRPAVSGRRRIPVLVNARGFPFLRIKKPQPKNLSGVLHSKLVRRQQFIDRRDRLEPEILFGHDEDKWDAMTTGSENTTWASEPTAALEDTRSWIKNSDKKKQALAEAMWKVVLAERDLAKKERQAEIQKRAVHDKRTGENQAEAKT
ncbi:hypothetical protein BJY04DRAFT_188325 [Aspergillus karnatakaensis]|uniref:LYR motif-containing protein n=1 Tax=Aspergillus karnatakaensis TaxID=1810916 RepID=UPI003CCDB30E